MENRLKLFLGQIVSLTYRYSSLCCFFVVIVSIIVADVLFHSVYVDWVNWLNIKFGLDIKAHEAVDLGFAPDLTICRSLNEVACPAPIHLILL